MTKCPECGGEIELPSDVVAGEIVSCPDCGESYEVGGDKVALKKAEKVAEDWGE